MSDIDIDTGEEVLPDVEETTTDGDQEVDFLYDPGVTIDEETKDAIVRYAKDELEVIENAREARETSWDTWRRHREGRPESATKDFPWEGASNLVPPVASSNTTGVFAHVRRAFLKRKPLWTVDSYKKSDARRSTAFQDFLNMYALSKSKANVEPQMKKALYEAVSLGDQFVEVPWIEDRIRFNRPGIDGTSVEKVDKIVYAGPKMVLHRIENVYARGEIDNLQDQPVVLVRYEGYTEAKLRELERDGFFTDVEPVIASQSSEEDDNLESALEREGLEVVDSSDTPMIDLFKAWVYWDIDDDGVAEDVIVWFHSETETILRVELNDFGYRLITQLKYFPITFSLYSTGVGSMAEHVQEEITSLHNMRINSIHLSSLQMLVTRPGTDLGKGQKLYPLKNIKADSPRDDIQVLTFPDVSGSTLEAEMQAKRYLDLHTGVSEAMLGMPDQTAKSGTSPSLQMFLAEQGNSILETAIESMAEGISEIGLFFMLQMVKNGESLEPHLEELVDPDDLDLVREVLQMGIEEVPLRMGMSVKTTEVQKSEDAKRQNLMAMNQLYSMYGQEVMQYMEVMQNPQVPDEMKQFALRIYLGKTKVMEETLELFGNDNTEDFVPYVRDVEMMLEMVDQQKRALTEQMSRQLGGQNGQGQGQPGMGPAGMGAVPPGGAANPGAGGPPPGAGAEGAPQAPPGAGQGGGAQGPPAGGGASQGIPQPGPG